MKINLQRESRWLNDIVEQNYSSDCVSLRSGDGVSLTIPASLLAASSEYLSHILHSHSHSCPHVNTVICLPAVSGFSLKLLSQILTVGKTEELSGESIKSCLENVGEVFELLRCKVKLVTKLSCSRASSQLKVVSFESLAHCADQVKEEFKETVEVHESEEMDLFNSHMEVLKEVGTEDCHHEKEKSRSLQGDGFGQSKSDLNHNMVLKPAHSVNHDMQRPSRHDSGIDKGCITNSFVREFQCSLCDLGFFTSVGLERHTSDKHGNEFREFKCGDCNLSYYTENSLYKHKHEKHGSENSEDQAKATELTPHQSCDYWQGPFTCTMCDYLCKSPNSFSKHWNEKHTEATHRVSFIDTATSTTVTLHQVFAFIVQCGLCGILRCANDSKKKAVLGITRHIQTNHHHQIGTGDISNNYSVLQDQQKTGLDASVVKNPVVAVDSTAVEKVPTIGEFTSKKSLSKTSYLGPYHCLSEGCSFVCDKFDRATKKLLMDHWSLKHGDVRCLLFLDVPSFTIINVKIICSNVGYCSYVGCDKLIFSSRRDLYQTYALNHWKNSHKSLADSYNPNMCKSISVKQVPDITEEEAAALVRRPTICKMIMDRTCQDDEHFLSMCAIPGCGDNVNLMTYASHFSKKHKELPLNNILVTTNDGRKLSCKDVFKSAIQCRLCSHVRVGGTNSRNRKSREGMRTHWLSEHKDMSIEEMSFIDIMAPSSDLGSSNITTDMEQQLLDNVDGDSDEVSIEDLL